MTDDRRSPMFPSGNDPAFPKELSNLIPKKNGMSRREHFAALFMAALLANPEDCNNLLEKREIAIDEADALLTMLGEADRGDS